MRVPGETSTGSRRASFHGNSREEFKPKGVALVEEEMEVSGVLHGSWLKRGKQHVILPGDEHFRDPQCEEVRAGGRSVLAMSLFLDRALVGEVLRSRIHWEHHPERNIGGQELPHRAGGHKDSRAFGKPCCPF